MGFHTVVFDFLSASCKTLVYTGWLSRCVRHRCEARLCGRTAFSCPNNTLSLKHLRWQKLFHLPATPGPRGESTDPLLRVHINALLPPPRLPEMPTPSRSNALQFKPRWHIVDDAAATPTCSLAGNSISAHSNYTRVDHRHTHYDSNIYRVSQSVYGKQLLASKTTSTYDCSSCRR